MIFAGGANASRALFMLEYDIAPKTAEHQITIVLRISGSHIGYLGFGPTKAAAIADAREQIAFASSALDEIEKEIP